MAMSTSSGSALTVWGGPRRRAASQQFMSVAVHLGSPGFDDLVSNSLAMIDVRIGPAGEGLVRGDVDPSCRDLFKLTARRVIPTNQARCPIISREHHHRSGERYLWRRHGASENERARVDRGDRIPGSSEALTGSHATPVFVYLILPI